MQKTQFTLLASHGTQGAMAAVQAAIELCQAGNELHHLIVVPELWQGMTGDDWLNNGSTRDTYRRYLESELGREIDEHCQLVQEMAVDKGIDYQRQIILGEPGKCLAEHSASRHFDLIVMGSPRPKGIAGLRSRMKIEPLLKTLSTPLLIIPFPEIQAND